MSTSKLSFFEVSRTTLDFDVYRYSMW